MMIDVGAENDGAERSHQIAGPEGHEGQHQRCIFVLCWKECSPDRRGVIAKDHEVVHLEEISHRDTHDRTEFLFLHFVSGDRSKYRAANSRNTGQFGPGVWPDECWRNAMSPVMTAVSICGNSVVPRSFLPSSR